jgi:hypothetical protein
MRGLRCSVYIRADGYNLLAARPIESAQTSAAFLRYHADGIASMDLFVVPTISGLVRFTRLPGRGPWCKLKHEQNQLPRLPVSSRDHPTLYLWRAVGLDCLVQSRRDKRAAKKLKRKLLKKQGSAPSHLVTDHLKSYSAAFQEMDLPPFTTEARE